MPNTMLKRLLFSKAKEIQSFKRVDIWKKELYAN